MPAPTNKPPIQVAHEGDLYKAYVDACGMITVLFYMSKVPMEPDVMKLSECPQPVINKILAEVNATRPTKS